MKALYVKWTLMVMTLLIIGYLLGQALFELPNTTPSESKEFDWSLPQARDKVPARQAAKRLLARFGHAAMSNQAEVKRGGTVSEWQLRGMLYEPPDSFVLIEQGGQIIRKAVGDSLPNGEILLGIDQRGILVDTLEGPVRVELYLAP
jgi:hypothetical protein